MVFPEVIEPSAGYDKKLRVGMYVRWHADLSIRGIITRRYIVDDVPDMPPAVFFEVKWLTETSLAIDGWYGTRFVPDKGAVFMVWNG